MIHVEGGEQERLATCECSRSVSFDRYTHPHAACKKKEKEGEICRSRGELKHRVIMTITLRSIHVDNSVAKFTDKFLFTVEISVEKQVTRGTCSSSS